MLKFFLQLLSITFNSSHGRKIFYKSLFLNLQKNCLILLVLKFFFHTFLEKVGQFTLLYRSIQITMENYTEYAVHAVTSLVYEKIAFTLYCNTRTHNRIWQVFSAFCGNRCGVSGHLRLEDGGLPWWIRRFHVVSRVGLVIFHAKR